MIRDRGTSSARAEEENCPEQEVKRSITVTAGSSVTFNVEPKSAIFPNSEIVNHVPLIALVLPAFLFPCPRVDLNNTAAFLLHLCLDVPHIDVIDRCVVANFLNETVKCPEEILRRGFAPIGHL